MATVRHLEFLKYANFNTLHGLQPQYACSCKILSGSVEWLRIYCKLLISNMAAIRHIEFLKYANFNFSMVCSHNLHVHTNFVVIGLTIAELLQI